MPIPIYFEICISNARKPHRREVFAELALLLYTSSCVLLYKEMISQVSTVSDKNKLEDVIVSRSYRA